MGSLTALLIATPLFGFSLTAPAVPSHVSAPAAQTASAETQAPAVVEGALDDTTAAPATPEPAAARGARPLDLTLRNVTFVAGEDDSANSADDSSASGDADANADASADSADNDANDAKAGKSSAADQSQADYIAQVKERNNIASIHRVLGIATWAAMTATVALGFISYYNLYGVGADQGHNPCVQGNAIGGDGGCNTFRTLHGIGAGVTTLLYAGTFTLSILMPDPDDLSSGKGEFASTLRLHKTLRWVHLGGMIAQIALGLIMASTIGADRANNYGTLQALATVHMGLGLVTLGALTWAGALMTF